uniref:Uncharacterized protein n=1 Tax=Loa loa TaxID=7209 RepID=A0A1I7V7D8_LOALO
MWSIGVRSNYSTRQQLLMKLSVIQAKWPESLIPRSFCSNFIYVRSASALIDSQTGSDVIIGHIFAWNVELPQCDLGNTIN